MNDIHGTDSCITKPHHTSHLQDDTAEQHGQESDITLIPPEYISVTRQDTRRKYKTPEARTRRSHWWTVRQNLHSTSWAGQAKLIHLFTNQSEPKISTSHSRPRELRNLLGFGRHFTSCYPVKEGLSPSHPQFTTKLMRTLEIITALEKFHKYLVK